MDSSSSSPNDNNNSSSWLGFSLSNDPHLHLSLFEAAFSSPNPANVVDPTTSSTITNIEAHHQHHAATSATDHHLDMFAAAAGAPKLEDFLGGGAQFSADNGQTTQISMSSGGNAQSLGGNHNDNSNVMYDSELKTIAASFLRGYSYTQQVGAQKNDVVSAPASLPAETVSPTAKKAVDSFGQRTSIYRGVTRHRWTGRYEAHLWDNSCRREGQSRKGRQVYLGGYDKEDKAARAYDLAALKYWGPTTTTNFPVCNYEKEIEEMKNMTRQEFVASLRRKSSGFSRGASIYRGVTRHHQHGRWQARIGRVAGNKDLYLGTFSTQEEAAEAYDIAAIKFRGLNAVTNFDMSRYDVKSIATTNLPIGGMSSTTKSSKSTSSPDRNNDGKSVITCGGGDDSSGSASTTTSTTTLNFATAVPTIKQDPSGADYWSNVFGFQNTSASSTAMLFHDHHLANNVNNIGGFLSYDINNNNITTPSIGMTINSNINNGYGTTNYDHHQQHHQQGSSGIIGWNNDDNNINIDSNNDNNIGSSLHSFNHHHHHQAHAKHPSTLFQTPIFGME